MRVRLSLAAVMAFVAVAAVCAAAGRYPREALFWGMSILAVLGPLGLFAAISILLKVFREALNWLAEKTRR